VTVSAKKKAMDGLGRTPLQQAKVNLEQALRVADMVKEQDSGLIPSPLTVLLAELRNARMYMELVKEEV